LFAIGLWDLINLVKTHSIIHLRYKFNQYYNIGDRVVAVIEFLSSRRLAFSGENKIFGFNHNGNFLGSLELLAKCYPFLAKHIKTHWNKERRDISYLSSTICDGFILIMGNEIIKRVVDELKLSKYYSIIVNCTLNVSKLDQWTLTINTYPNISLEDCRGQSYDNSKYMSGIYSGIQARSRQVANMLSSYKLSSLVKLNRSQCCSI